jgi:hypothetical protein
LGEAAQELVSLFQFRLVLDAQAGRQAHFVTAVSFLTSTAPSIIDFTTRRGSRTDIARRPPE